MTGERITIEQAAHVARLARLDVTGDELALYTMQLEAVLEYAGQVAAVDTSSVQPTAHATPAENVMRKDEPGECLERDDVLREAPESMDGMFLVPRILGEAP